MSAKTYIGLDVGGTKIAVGRIRAGRVIFRSQLPSDSTKGAAATLRAMEKAVEQAWAPGVAGIGVGIAGLVSHERGVFLGGPNLPKGLAGLNLAQRLRRRFKVPVTIDNDVHCFTLAEAKLGAGRHRASVIGLNLGTGIGGGLATNGRLVRGRNNGAGEFGHATVALGSKFRCSCGRLGHFEALASGTAMHRIYAGLGGRAAADALEVERRAKRGEGRAKKVFAIMADGLAAGLANLIQTLNPDMIVVGGGLARADMLWKAALKLVPGKISYAAFRSTPIVRSKLGAHANLLGAALLAAEPGGRVRAH